MERSNNAFVIIGNGFDLAHGAKTSYMDFAEWIFEILVKELHDSLTDKCESELFNGWIQEGFRKYKEKGRNGFDGAKSNADLFDIVLENDLTKTSDFLRDRLDLLSIHVTNSLLGKLLSDLQRNWFDVEETYFKELCKLMKHENASTHVEKLNRELKYVRDTLIDYLENITIVKNSRIQDFLYRELRPYGSVLSNDIIFIDFNYTETILKYPIFEDLRIPIHGTLEKDNIIFGYGNDQDEEYQELKKLGENAFLENMKTFEYVMNPNYSRIVEEVNKCENGYDVLVLGHSLGVTDKTLLQEIFDDENCRNIFLYKRSDLNEIDQKRDFKTKSMALSRIMKKDRDLRNKLVDYDSATSFP